MAFFPNDYNQLSIDDSTFFLTERELKFLEKSWAKPFADKIFPAINEDDFSVLYSDSASRPNTPVNVIIGALILKEWLGLTDEEIVESLMFDIRFQVALHTTSFKEQPLSDRSLSRFRERCTTYEAVTSTDLVRNCMNSLASKMAEFMGLSSKMNRMDSMMIAANIKKLSRLELLYTCVANLVKHMQKRQDIVPESMNHYCEPEDYNRVIYHMRSTDAETRMKAVLSDAAMLSRICADKYDESSEYQLLLRVTREQTSLEEDGSLHLKDKNASMGSDVLLNPSDPDATFRQKAGVEHRGYVANLTETTSENGSIITDYAYEQNIYSDSQFLKDYLNSHDLPEDSTIVADGAYCGERNTLLAKEQSATLVTTNFTGRKPEDIYADFIFSEDGKSVLKCANGYEPLTNKYDSTNDRTRITMNKEFCNQCPYKEQCKPKLFKRKSALEVSWKTANRAKQLRYMKSDEFKEYSHYRNGVESLPSILRRRYQVDRMPVRGKLKTKLYFGFKVAALNFGKLFSYLNSLASSTSEPEFC